MTHFSHHTFLLLCLSFTILLMPIDSLSSDLAAGKTKAAVCAACHGSNGISSDPAIPNLAGQKETYLANQLNAFREAKRNNPLMNAIAATLSDDEINNVAHFFAQLKQGDTNSGIATNIIDDVKTQKIQFPKNYQQDFHYYTTVNVEKTKQVRDLYTNDAGIKTFKKTGQLGSGSIILMEIYAAKVDKNKVLLTDINGTYQKDKLIAYAVMENQASWGDAFPKELNNGDWNYAFFTSQKNHKEGLTQARCLACHQPLKAQSYMFTFDSFKEQFSVNDR